MEFLFYQEWICFRTWQQTQTVLAKFIHCHHDPNAVLDWTPSQLWGPEVTAVGRQALGAAFPQLNERLLGYWYWHIYIEYAIYKRPPHFGQPSLTLILLQRLVEPFPSRLRKCSFPQNGGQQGYYITYIFLLKNPLFCLWMVLVCKARASISLNRGWRSDVNCLPLFAFPWMLKTLGCVRSPVIQAIVRPQGR